MSIKIFFLSLLLIVTPSFVYADQENIDQELSKEASDDRSFIVGTLLYIPNRVFDLLDIVRFRVRVGPGFAIGARATEPVSAYIVSYASAYAGLPGPRLRQTPVLPVGLESHNGASLSIVDATIDGGIGPGYSWSEIGVGTQLGIVGFDFGIDPVEIVDFMTGIITIDLRGDDL